MLAAFATSDQILRMNAYLYIITSKTDLVLHIDGYTPNKSKYVYEQTAANILLHLQGYQNYRLTIRTAYNNRNSFDGFIGANRFGFEDMNINGNSCGALLYLGVSGSTLSGEMTCSSGNEIDSVHIDLAH